MKPQDLYTRKRANEGIPVYLVDSLGKPIDVWLRVRGLDSDAYRKAHDVANRVMARLAAVVRAAGSDAKLLEATQAEKDAETLAERVALVADWNLEGDCTPEAVTELLREAPYIADQVWEVANERDRFFGKDSANSINGLSTSLDAVDPQQKVQTTL